MSQEYTDVLPTKDRSKLKCAGVAGEEEGSVGGPTHILQAAENSCRTSLLTLLSIWNSPFYSCQNSLSDFH